MRAELMDKTFTIWVTEVFIGCTMPKVTQYTATRLTATGATVLYRAGSKIIPVASGRRFFKDRTVLNAYLVNWFKDARETAERKAELYGYLERSADILASLAAEVCFTVIPVTPR